MEAPRRPSNLEIRLEHGAIFWTFDGMLTNDSYDINNFAEQVNIYLDNIKAEEGENKLRFLVKSDTHGEIKIEINLDYSLLQTQIWENPLDDTIRFDRNLQLDFGMIERIHLDPIADKNNNTVSLKNVSMDIGGEFNNERLLGNIEDNDEKIFATISTDYSLAQKFELETSIKCVGISGFFKARADAELYVEIQNNIIDVPAAEEPLAKANIPIINVEKNGEEHWVFVNFETPVDLKVDTPYWIVVKGVQGDIKLGLQSKNNLDSEEKNGYLQNILVNRGGQLWKPIGSGAGSVLEALLSLVYEPTADNQSTAVEIGIKGTQLAQRFDSGPEVQTITFNVNAVDVKDITIEIKSRVQGTFSIANVMQEYLPL